MPLSNQKTFRLSRSSRPVRLPFVSVRLRSSPVRLVPFVSGAGYVRFEEKYLEVPRLRGGGAPLIWIGWFNRMQRMWVSSQTQDSLFAASHSSLRRVGSGDRTASALPQCEAGARLNIQCSYCPYVRTGDSPPVSAG